MRQIRLRLPICTPAADGLDGSAEQVCDLLGSKKAVEGYGKGLLNGPSQIRG